jgi:hypothetical protein
MARPIPLVAPVMKAVVTWASPIAWRQFAASADTAKPRKPAKRKDKLSKTLAAFEMFYACGLTANATNQRKTGSSAREVRFRPSGLAKTWLSQDAGRLPPVQVHGW